MAACTTPRGIITQLSQVTELERCLVIVMYLLPPYFCIDTVVKNAAQDSGKLGDTSCGTCHGDHIGF